MSKAEEKYVTSESEMISSIDSFIEASKEMGLTNGEIADDIKNAIPQEILDEF